MRYRPLQEFVAAARPRDELWRTAAGAVVAVAAGLALYQFALALLAMLLGPQGLSRLLDEATFHGDTVLGTLALLLSYGFFALGLMLAVRAIHGRGPLSLLGGWEGALSDFMRVTMATLALYLLLALILPQDHDYLRNERLGVGGWMLLLPISLAAVMIQAGSEELFFRGYLQQQLGARMPGPAVWLVLPSVLFGLAHWSPDLGENALPYMLWAMAFGLAAGDLTARTGALGAALGLHFANNAMAILVTALPGPGSGLALWHIPLSPADAALGPLIWVEFASLLCAWLAARLALRV